MPPPLSPTNLTAASPWGASGWEAHEGLIWWHCEQGNTDLSVWESVAGWQGWCQPSQAHRARCHLGVTSVPSGTALLLLPHLLQLLCFPVLAVFEITWSWATGLPIHRAGTLLPDQQEHPTDPTGSIPRQTKAKGEEGHPQQAAFFQQQCNSDAVRSPI